MSENLEEVLKKKVIPLIEESMQKSWGVVIHKIEEDITDKLLHHPVDTLINFDLSFSEAKIDFKKKLFERELQKHKGNISKVALFLGIDRRSIHRAIHDLGIDLDRAELKKEQIEIEESTVSNSIKEAIGQYASLLQDEKIESMYKELPRLSKTIAKELPHQEMSWKEAEAHFEEEYLKHHLESVGGKVKDLALKVGLRAETVSRKLSKLGVKQAQKARNLYK